MPFGFPDVPNLPGVPPLPRAASVVINALALLVSDLFGFGDLPSSEWGIFLDGIPVLIPDTIATFDFRQSWSISDYPLEQGAFESYDKVNSPFETRVRLGVGGSVAERQAFLDELDAAAQGLELYDVVTPEKTYQSVNISRYEMRRSPTHGLGLVAVDVWLTQIRVTASAQFSQTQTPSGASAVNSGNVQTQTPTLAQVHDISFMQ